MTAPLRVLLSGANYGRNYIAAMRRRPDMFELSAILSRGSERSAELARECGVRLFTDPQSVGPEEVDLACAAMGRSGNPVLLELLRRGIHVLCEHPQSSEFINEACGEARRSGTIFHLNGHFLKLPPARAFIRACLEEAGRERPVLIGIETSGRLLYATLDIVRSALGPFSQADTAVVRRGFPFTLLTGAVNEIPITLQVQQSQHPTHGKLPDASPSYVLEQRITIGFPSGVLTLSSVAGPVVWTANFGGSTKPGSALWAVIGPQTAPNHEMLNEWRTEANLESLLEIARSIEDESTPQEQKADHILDVSRFCDQVKATVIGSVPV